MRSFKTSPGTQNFCMAAYPVKRSTHVSRCVAVRREIFCDFVCPLDKREATVGPFQASTSNMKQEFNCKLF